MIGDADAMNSHLRYFDASSNVNMFFLSFSTVAGSIFVIFFDKVTDEKWVVQSRRISLRQTARSTPNVLRDQLHFYFISSVTWRFCSDSAKQKKPQ